MVPVHLWHWIGTQRIVNLSWGLYRQTGFRMKRNRGRRYLIVSMMQYVFMLVTNAGPPSVILIWDTSSLLVTTNYIGRKQVLILPANLEKDMSR